MSNLFSTQSEKAGFRLNYVEIMNWGTFQNDTVFRIEPKGNNSLLTGANASGKSTFVDALLTLLVPFKKDRFYNQSSGVDKKGDRTEETYVLGQYGKTQKEGKTKILTLRNEDTYSVILASFVNTDDRIITLFQIRWFSNGTLKRSFGISYAALDIKKDFLSFDPKGNWKKRLDKLYNTNTTRKKINFFNDEISKYRNRIIKIFGMQSEKALVLFNQIVGVKVLEDLDVFIRTTMLEEEDAEAEFIDLKQNFNTLIKAQTDINKVIEQIEQLTPISKLIIQLEENTTKLEQLNQDKQTALYWFAQKSVELGQKELSKIVVESKQIKEELAKLKEEKGKLEDEKSDLLVAIKQDEVSNRIEELKKEIENIEKESNKRISSLEKFNQLAKEVDIIQNPTKKQFLEVLETVILKKEESEKHIDKENRRLRDAETKQEQIKKEIEKTVIIIETLRKNKNNISGRVAQIREEIIHHLGLTKEEIPFVGELIRVKEEEQKWESSLEKILHSFALRLIVPQNYLYKVNQFVSNENLKGKIVYESYDNSLSRFVNTNKNTSQNSLAHKLEFKQNSSKNDYKEWLEGRVFNQFDFECLDKIEVFNGYNGKAVTENGLIKYGRGKRYEKDDRPDSNLRSNYVLGWDNVEKIRFYQRELKEFQAKEYFILDEIKAITKIISVQNVIKNNATRIINEYENYDQIDWESCVIEIDEKTRLKKELETTNDVAKKLNEQLVFTKNKLDKIDKTSIPAKTKELINKENAETAVKNQIDENQAVLNTIEKIDCSDFENLYVSFINQINFENLPSKRNEFQTSNNNHLEKLDKENGKIKLDLQFKIVDFKKPSEKITNNYKDWRADVDRLPDAKKLDLVSEYQNFLDKLNEQDLPSYKKRFNDYLNDNMISNVHKFSIFFRNWKETIEDRMYQLNKSLKEIDYESAKDNETYIQLAITKRRDENINEFEKLLIESLPNINDVDEIEEGRKKHFERHIKPFMDRLEEENWRKKVMDVRAWFSYKAEEIYRKDEQKGRVYEGMGELSGGEKAQLTYTILGAAISSQFGLTKEGTQTNSFRFIAIDEAFKAQDEDKSRYLVRLCKQLHLQFLVVTPSDNIDIVQDDISFIHYVERINKTHSYLKNMTIEQYKLLKEENRISKLLQE